MTEKIKYHDPAGTATRAAGLGVILGGSLCYAITTQPDRPQLFIYFASLALFHLLEYWTTAKYNAAKVNNKSFLLSSNGLAYWAAQLFGVLEYLVEERYWAEKRSNTSLALISKFGLILIILGQIVRSAAMITAAQSFSHALAYSKKEDHILVTDGIYAYSFPDHAESRYLRHPSYFGFFWFGIGTQLMLCNPLATLIFTLVLWRFFSERIRYVLSCLVLIDTAEEYWLMRFFGKEYELYRARVGTRIPFIK